MRLPFTCRPRVWAKSWKWRQNDLSGQTMAAPRHSRLAAPPSAEQQTHTHRSYNKCIMEQQPSWQNVSEAWGFIYLSICFTMPVLLFIIRVRFPASQGSLLAGLPKLLHSFAPSNTPTQIQTHTATENVILLGCDWPADWDSYMDEDLLQQLRCLKQGMKELQPNVPECVCRKKKQ